MAAEGKDFSEVVGAIVKSDARYEAGAYHFVRRALDHTLRQMDERGGESPRENSRHVSGTELLEGIRQYAVDQYGPMTLTLFEQWGVQRSEDFGEIVFNLVDYGVFGKTETDQREDFRGALDFHEAFAKPYLPRNPLPHGLSSPHSQDN